MQSTIENRKSKIRLTELQAVLLETARRRGRVAVSNHACRRRRRAARRLRDLGLLEWSAHYNAWVATEAGVRHCSQSSGTRVERYQDRTPGLEYSDFVRAN